jgi:hypothetical protein
VKSCFVFVLVMAAFVTGCSKARSGAEVDKAFRHAVPSDAQTLFALKFDKLKGSELYRRHEQQLELPVFDAMSERLGLDPRRDLSNVLLVWDGTRPLLLAQGTLSDSQLEAKLTAGGAQRVPYKSFTLFTRAAESVSFPDHSMAVAGSTEAVHSALDLLSAHAGAVPDELQERLAEVPADSQIWGVSRGGLPLAGFPLGSELQSNLSNIAAYVSGASFGVRFDSGSHLQMRIICKSPEGAQRIQDTLRGLIGLARLSTHDNELDLLRMWDAISTSKDQQAVNIKADLAADLSDKLIAQVLAMRGRAGGVLNPR